MSEDQDRNTRRESLGPEYEAFEKRALSLIRERREAYEKSLRSDAATPADTSAAPRPTRPAPPRSPSPRRGFLGRFTLPQLSYALNGLFLVFLLAGWQFRTFIFPPDFVPPLTIHGNVVSVLSPDQKEVIWSRDFSPYFVAHAEIAPWEPEVPWGHRRKHLVVAVGDGTNRAPNVAVYDFRNTNPEAAPVWTHDVHAEELRHFFPPETLENDDIWCNGFTFADIDGDGTAELATLFHHQNFFPSCLRTLDRDGNVLGTYYNWGYLERVVAADLDGDGMDEIVASGTNNVKAYQGATVLLLDKDHLDGYSVDPELPREGFHDGSLARVVLPVWDEQVARPVNIVRLATDGLQIWAGEPPRISVKVGKDFLHAMQKRAGRTQREHYVIVEFDRDLNPLGVIPHDGLLDKIREAQERGEITLPADTYEYWEEWLGKYKRFGALSQVP